MILVTGGAGFIGSNFVLQWIEEEKSSLVNLDKLTYAGNLNNLVSLEQESRHHFICGDIQDQTLVEEIFDQYHPRAVIHCAAETHVDRSIITPSAFFQTNVMGTQALLDVTLAYWKRLSSEQRNNFRFLNVSTDEVYGSIGPEEPPAKETTAYAPNSPYAASKASSDHLVRAYFHTYGLPILTTHCSNNFGPYQFPEKFIPLMIINALERKPLPLYGDGLNVRNWIYVADHCLALRLILAKGKPGEVYNIGSEEEYTNKEVALILCKILDELKATDVSYANLITYIGDRPGHDRRYSLDVTKAFTDLGWKTSGTFKDHLRYTIQWYLHNKAWVENVIGGEYRNWITTQYHNREDIR